jgi:hypothetical protein
MVAAMKCGWGQCPALYAIQIVYSRSTEMETNNSLAAGTTGRRRPAVEPTGEPFDSLKQSIAQLSSLKKKLLNQALFLKSDPSYQGQSWAGAGAMVISADVETREQFAHCLGHDAILCTVHAYAIGNLYRKLLNITSGNYLTKFEMWGLATEAGREAASLNPSISQTDLAVVIVDEVIRIHKLWRRRAANDGRTHA